MNTYFTTSIDSFDIFIIIATLGIFSWFFYNNMKNTANKKGTFVLEILRFITVILILIVLCEPELVKVEDKKEKPQLKILYDSSGSMLTDDVIDKDGKVATREAVVKNLLANGFDPKLTERYDVSLENFAGLNKKNDSTDIDSALTETIEKMEKLKGVVLLTDGSWNTGKNPLETALMFRAKGVPIYTVATGRENYLPDLVLEKVSAPAFGLLNEKILIPFSVRNYLNREVRVNVVLSSGRIIRMDKAVKIGPGQVTTDSFMIQPKFEGKYDFDLQVEVLQEEINKENNLSKFSIDFRQEQIKVLVIDSKPRWEYRYLRNALQRDPGVTVHTLLFHQNNMKIGEGLGYLTKFPESREELSTYDVIFLGDVGVDNGFLKKEQYEMIRGLVEKQGSGLVFMPGQQGNHIGWQETEINDLLPVVFDTKSPKGKAYEVESKLILTAAGQDHLLTLLNDTPAGNDLLWKQLPGFYWCTAVTKARVGSTTLAVHASLRNENGRMPLLVTRPFGNGNTLFLGTDSAWRWRKGVEDKYHYRFWGQVVRWMANKRHMNYSEQVRLFHSPERITTGDKVQLQATVFDKSGFPKSGSQIFCLVTAPDKSEKLFAMTEDAGGWGLYKGEFATAVAGEYLLKITSADKTVEYNTKLIVSGEVLEKVGEPVNVPLLKDVARITNGSYLSVNGFSNLLKTLQEMPEEKPKELRIRIWNQWWWGGLIIGLAGIYWIMRKRIGLT